MASSTATAQLSFSKYCAAGNDFILIEDPTWDPHEASALCNRRYGIGADGVIWTPAPLQMRIFNADGSEAEMCGNGLRALAFHLGQNTTISTVAGPYQVRKDGAILMPQPTSNRVDNHTIIDSGVPHLILEGPWDPAPLLRKKYNANISAIIDGKARTYERGVEGETYSCGTGALALAHHYNLKEVTFASGETLTFTPEGRSIWMHGTVIKTFSGKMGSGLAYGD